jgi:hypothetical protein
MVIMAVTTAEVAETVTAGAAVVETEEAAAEGTAGINR